MWFEKAFGSSCIQCQAHYISSAIAQESAAPDSMKECYFVEEIAFLTCSKQFTFKKLMTCSKSPVLIFKLPLFV